MSKKNKKVCMAPNHIEQSLNLVSIFDNLDLITRCVSISAFASLVCIFRGVASAAVELKIFVITAGITEY